MKHENPEKRKVQDYFWFISVQILNESSKVLKQKRSGKPLSITSEMHQSKLVFHSASDRIQKG